LRDAEVKRTFQREVWKMFIVAIDEELCTGCDECAAGCPVEILTFENGKTYVTGDEAECMGCDACTTVCDSGAITVTEY
jgi:ferredoxin